MLCNLAVHLTREDACMLRVSGVTAVGPSELGGRDEKHYSTAEALLRELDAFGLNHDVAAAAVRELASPEARMRFVKFAENVQISFDMLERAEIYLFD